MKSQLMDKTLYILYVIYLELYDTLCYSLILLCHWCVSFIIHPSYTAFLEDWFFFKKKFIYVLVASGLSCSMHAQQL